MYVVDKNENNFHKYKDASLKPMLRQDIKKYIDKLLRDAHSLGLPLIVDSGYRSYNYQKVVLNALIKEKGDEALFAYTEKFDKCKLTKDTIQVTEEEIKAIVKEGFDGGEVQEVEQDIVGAGL